MADSVADVTHRTWNIVTPVDIVLRAARGYRSIWIWGS